MGDIAFTEILVVVVVAIIVFGKNLPQVARKAAEQYVRLKMYLQQVRDEVMRSIPDEADLKVPDPPPDPVTQPPPDPPPPESQPPPDSSAPPASAEGPAPSDREKSPGP